MFEQKETKLQHAWHVLKHYAYDLFIPHEGNDHRPHALHHRALTAYAVLLVLVKVGAVVATISLPASSVFSSAINPENIISLTNVARAGTGLQPVVYNGQLASAAQNKANDMALNEYFAHTSPAGVTPWYWVRSAGYTYTYAGENLAVHFSEAEDVTAGWMASPSHRANILEPRFKEIGVGVSYGRYQDYSTTFVVQMFGVNEAAEPAPLPEPSPEPESSPEEVVETTEAVPVEDPVTETVPATKPSPTEEPGEQVQGEEVEVPSNVVVTPKKQEYAIEVDVPGAESVALQLAGDTEQLTQNEDGSWGGSIQYDPALIDDSGTELVLLATDEYGDQREDAVSYIAPESGADDVYAFQSSKAPKGVFGALTGKGVNDAVQMLFLFVALMLGIGMIMTMLLRKQKKHHSMLVQILSVLVLVLILSVV